MPIVNGEYEQKTLKEYYDALASELKTRFGDDIDLTSQSVFRSLATALSDTFADEVEPTLEDIYDSAYLESASGDDLEKVVAIVGMTRQEARHATGVERFIHSDIPDAKYTVNKGTIVQTGGDTPVKFETMETASTELLDDMESAISNHSGDLSEFTQSSTQAFEGSSSYRGEATSGTVMWRNDRTIRQGHTISYRVYLNTNTVAHQYVLLQDADNAVRTVLDSSAGTHKIEVVDATVVTDSTSESVSIPNSEWLRNEIQITTQNEVISTVYDANGNEVSSITLDEGASASYEEGHYGFGSGDATSTKYWDEVATTAVEVDIRAQEGGSIGNLSSNTLTVSPSPPSGYDEWINPYPTGDETYTDVSNNSFNVGRDEETDSELRTRTQETFTSGGTATFDALLSALVNDVEGVLSATIFENDTDSSQTINGGTALPPFSFEAVVHGGNDTDIAEAIFNTKAVTARDTSGHHGAGVTVSITSDINDQTQDISFTRPTEVKVSFDDIVLRKNDEYVGDDEIRNLITDYIGGTDTDGNSVLGTDVGEDVYIDRVEDIVVGEETGVVGIEVDSNGDTKITTTPTKTTTGDNLQVVSIGDTEVANIDDASSDITITSNDA